VHDGDVVDGAVQQGVREAGREAAGHLVRRRGVAQGVDQGRGGVQAGHAADVPDPGGPGPVRHQGPQHGGPGLEGRGGQPTLPRAPRHRARQEGEAQHPVPGDHGPEHGRGVARGGLAAHGGQAQGGHAGELEARGVRRHRAKPVGRGGQQDVPAGVPDRRPAVQQGVPPLHQDRLDGWWSKLRVHRPRRR
jgi:hypothetical protein